MFSSLRNLFRRKIKTVNKPLRRGQVQAGQQRLIAWPLVNLLKWRVGQQLPAIDSLAPESRQAIINLNSMSDDEIRNPRKRWSDPV